MPISPSLADVLTKRLPAVISPRTRAFTDYAMSASFLAAGALFWRRNQRAALAAILSGSAGLALNLFTNYGKGVKGISMPTRRKIDFALAATVAAMPEVMKFHYEPERRFFVTQAAILTAVTNLTDSRDTGFGPGRKRPRRAA